MSSREQILAAVKANQPSPGNLPGLESFIGPGAVDLDASRQLPDTFRKVATGMGSRLFDITHESEIPALVKQHYTDVQQVVAADPALYDVAAFDNWRAASDDWRKGDGRQLQQVDLAIVKAQLGVAENGALWLTEEDLQVRVLPFIAQHLAVVLSVNTIVPTMHHAYEQIGAQHTGFGVFIAGPSKTADIEQSLVLGAHGAKSLTIFLKK